MPPLQIRLVGSVERPTCHFELPSILDDLGKRVIEFECLGVNSFARRKFYVINPTKLGYDYLWRPGDKEKSKESPPVHFNCLKMRGTILSGKKSEMLFEFRPSGLTERKVDQLWTFEVPSQGIKETFHLVGTVLEPKIFFNNARVDFGPLLLKGRGKERVILKNFDDIPYSFKFTKHSLRGPDRLHAGCLSVKPLSGVVPPRNEVPINLEFVPLLENAYNYNLQCAIEQRSEPLALNIKGEGYKLHHLLSIDRGKGLNAQELNLIDFGEMFVKDSKSQVLTISNTGNFNFDFMIKFKEAVPGIEITPRTSTGEHIPQ